MPTKERKPKKMGVLMIDFNPVVREGLQSILTKDERIEVIGDAPDGHQALQLSAVSDNGTQSRVE